MNIDILTLFPEMFDGPFSASMIKRAATKGLVNIRPHDLRNWTEGPHRIADDSPFGGGAGMVLKPEPVFRAVEELTEGKKTRVILLTPQGDSFCQPLARELAGEENMLLICGHYEGFDERIRTLADQEISIGDYVLTGGEIPALVLVDAVVRLLPGVLGGGSIAAQTDSFGGGLLEGPHYTRPQEFRGLAVPDVLLSGDHGAIDRWRRKEALRRTWQRRPDLLAGAPLGREDLILLTRIGEEKDYSN